LANLLKAISGGTDFLTHFRHVSQSQKIN